jgi:hypothetical protein
MTDASLSSANKLARVYRQTLDLRAKIAASNLAPVSKASLLFELDAKIEQFQSALKNLLGLDLIAFTTKGLELSGSGPFPGGSADETPRSVTPGEEFRVRVHTGRATTDAALGRVWLESTTGDEWKSENTPAQSTQPTIQPLRQTRSSRFRHRRTPSPPSPTSRGPRPSRPTTTSPTPLTVSVPSPPGRSRLGRVHI